MPTKLCTLCIALFASLAGLQTVNLYSERAAHSHTKEQWATETAQSTKTIARLGETYRAQEGAWKERTDAATLGYFRAAEESATAAAALARADDRMRQLTTQIRSAAAGVPSTPTTPGDASSTCSAQLAACAGLLADGAELQAEGARLAGQGWQLTAQLEREVTLCQKAWPQ